MGVVLKVGATELYHTIIPSPESRGLIELGRQTTSLEKLGNMQLQASRFSNELELQVRDIYLILKLKEPNNFEDICPLSFGLEFMKTIETGNLHVMRVAVEDSPLIITNNDGKIMKASGYKIGLSADFPVDYRRDFLYGPGEVVLDNLIVQIPYGGRENDNLFRTLRDFHGSHFTLYLSKNLISISERIALLVNGWAIVNSELQSVYWKSEVMMSGLFSRSTEHSTPWTGDFHGVQPPEKLWSLDLMGTIPKFVGNIAGY